MELIAMLAIFVFGAIAGISNRDAKISHLEAQKARWEIRKIECAKENGLAYKWCMAAPDK